MCDVLIIVLGDDRYKQGMALGSADHIDAAVAEATFKYLVAHGDPDRESVPPPARGSTPATAALWGSAAALRNGEAHGNGGPPAVMDPPRPAQPAYSPDGLTIFDQDGPKCGKHKIGKPSTIKGREGTWFCPKREGGEYCQWVYPPAARA